MTDDKRRLDAPPPPRKDWCEACDGGGVIVVHFRHGLQEQDCIICAGTGVKPIGDT